MKRFLERVHTKSTEVDKAWAIIDHLEGETRNYIINNSEPERVNPKRFLPFWPVDWELTETGCM